MESNLSDMNETLITLTSDIVAAHVSNNSVAVSDLPVLITNVYGALAGLGQVAAAPPAMPEPAVSIRSGRLGPGCRSAPRYARTGCVDPFFGKGGLHYLPGRRQEAENAQTSPDDALQSHPGSVSRPLGSFGGLPDGRPQLCRKAPRTGQEDRPWSQARPEARAQAQSRLNAASLQMVVESPRQAMTWRGISFIRTLRAPSYRH